jgi:hypothetical protein
MNMVESADTSVNRNLLTPPNAILTAALVLAVSLVWACATMMRPNDSGGMGRDSFGTRNSGFRALFETLQELQVPVRRNLEPPAADASANTLVLLRPDSQLVQFEPRYLKSLESWINNGGRLVLALGRIDERTRHFDYNDDAPGEHDILKLLELDDFVSLREQSASKAVLQERGKRAGGEDLSASEELRDAWSYKTPKPRVFKVEATGSLTALGIAVRNISTPGDEFGVLAPGTQKSAGTLRLVSNEGGDVLLAAIIPRGNGEIVVVSDAALLSNMLLARSDNSVLAAQLLAPRAESVAFDEYYHGLAVRGNPLYLLTRAGFATVAAAIVLAIGVLAWRSAVFLGPPLADVERSRRNIEEYVNAMGAFFCRGLGYRRLLATEVRDGVLHELCEQLNLPSHTTDVGTISAALARRRPARADMLRKALAEIDSGLAHPGEYPKSSFLSSMQRLAGCL